MRRNKERQIILNLFIYNKSKISEKSVGLIANETIQATGTSRASVFRISGEDVRGPLVNRKEKGQTIKWSDR